MEYDIVIGIETHVQVKTAAKMFCHCKAEYFSAVANTYVCPVCLGLPGALPYPNKLAIEKCVKLALALNCDINQYSYFERKNYFYPDLPKGYQISQSALPFGQRGYLEIDVDDDSTRIRINRVHMEEDTGKSTHSDGKTMLDFNKSGIPLVEIVTEPDFTNVKEVTAYAKRLKQIVKYLDVSNADMEKGQMRFELNMSLKPSGTKDLPKYKVEVKNIGSISVLEKVIAFEYQRQKVILEQGKMPEQETRGLRDLTGETHSQRKKEIANDYRYFPEPDIPPIVFTDKQIQDIKLTIDELPQLKKARYMDQFGLEANLAEAIIISKVKADWFEQAVKDLPDPQFGLEVAKWFVGDVFAKIKADKIKLAELKFKPADLGKLIVLLKSGKVSGSIAKNVLAKMYETGRSPQEIISSENMEMIDDDNELKVIIAKIIALNAKVIEDMAKNPNAVKFLVGQVMRETKGKADPQKSEKLLLELLQ